MFFPSENCTSSKSLPFFTFSLSFQPINKIVLHEVIGCPGESDRGKRPMMAKIATDKSEVTMLTSDNPKSEDPCKYKKVV